MSSVEVDERGLIVTCPSCGKHNRLVYERLGQAGRCAQCGTALRLPGEPLEITDANAFTALTTQARIPVLVDFWAAWCGPCKMMAPELARAAAAADGRWIAAKVDTEALPELAQQFGVSAIPLLVLFKSGREAARAPGARPASAIQQFVQQHA